MTRRTKKGIRSDKTRTETRGREREASRGGCRGTGERSSYGDDDLCYG